jgi:hypothetical protein
MWMQLIFIYEGNVPKNDIPFFAKFFIGLGNEVTVKNPPELLDGIKRILSQLMAKYDWNFSTKKFPDISLIADFEFNCLTSSAYKRHALGYNIPKTRLE